MKKWLPIFFALAVAGCKPEIGSDAWCAGMKEKPRGEWTMNETGDYAKHCIFN